MRVVVTGGAGFIGGNLCRVLSTAPGIMSIASFDDLSTGFESNVDKRETSLIVGSILDQELLTKTVQGADVIVHLAARSSVPRSVVEPRRSHDVNSTGTLNVLESARATGARVIIASSSSVYGANLTLPKDESLAPRPMSPYAATKLAAESYALAWAHSYGLGVLAFRFFNVYGPLQRAGHAYAAVIPAFLDAANRGETLLVHGDGTQSRDFTFVDSVCEVIRDTISRGVTHSTPVNLALGTRTSLNELIEEVRDVCPGEVAVEYREPRIGDVLHSSADPTQLRALFPEVQPIALSEGLRKTYAWMTGRAAALA